MRRAAQRPFRRGAAVLGCLCAFSLCPLGSLRAQDDWSLTRPDTGRPQSSAPRPAAAATSRAADPGASAARALEQALARPLDTTRVERLIATYRQRDGDLHDLAQELSSRERAARERDAAAPPDAHATGNQARGRTDVGATDPERGGAGAPEKRTDVGAADPERREARAAGDQRRALTPRQLADRALWILLAQVYAELGQVERARGLFERAASLSAETALLRVAARFERGAGQFVRARVLLERALEPVPAVRTEPPPSRTELLQELGELELDLHDSAAAGEHFAAASRLNPGSLSHALALARALRARGESKQAATAYAAAIERLRADPRVLPPLYLELAALQLAAADHAGALQTLERAERLIPRGTGLYAQLLEARFSAHRELGTLPKLAQELAPARDADSGAMLARVYEELDQPAEAVSVLRRVLGARPFDVASAERVITLLWREGRVDEVIAEYKRLLRAAPNEARFASELCELLFQAGRRAEALSLLDKLSRDNPRDVRMHETIAELYTRFGANEAAQRELHLLAQLDPADPERFVNLGEAELSRGHRDAARAAFRRVVQGAPSAPGHMRLAQIFLDHEFAEEALAEYDKAQKLRPNDPQIARGRAQVLARMFRYKDALAEWERALALAGDDRSLRRDARKELVGLWDELSELKRHIAELEPRCGYTPGHGFPRGQEQPSCDLESARLLAEAYERMARRGGARAEPLRYLRAAEDMLAAIARSDARDLESLLALERLRVKRGDLDAAIAALEQLVEADPDNRRIYLGRMVSYALARYHDDRAARYAQRAVEAAPEDAAVHEQLGDLYRAQNDIPRALQSYERALALDPTRFGLAWRVAQHELAAGRIEAAERRLRAVLSGSQDDELVMRALRSALQLRLSEPRLLELERELVSLALASPPRPVYRRALLELYAVLVPGLSERARGAEPEASRARAELSAIGRRAAKPLLEALADRDLAQARLSISLLAEVGNAGAARALLSFAEGSADLDLRRDALRVSAIWGGDEFVPRFIGLTQVREARLQAVAAWALARGESAASSAALRALAESPAPSLRSCALLGLARRADPHALPLLQQAFARDRSPLVRVAAALGLGMLGQPIGGDALAEANAHGQPAALAEAALLGLGLLGDDRHRQLLAQRVFAGDARVRSAAGLALRALGHEQRILFETPLPVDRSEPGDLLGAARTALLAAASGTLTRFAVELREAASEALRGDDAGRLAVLTFLANDVPAAPPLAAAGVDPRELPPDLRMALLPELAGLRAHADPNLRALLVKTLSPLNAPAADALLMDLAQDRVVEVRAVALQALSERNLSNLPGWAERLSPAALGEPAYWLRQRAVRVLARLPSASATQTLARVLSTDAYALVRESAAQSLAGRDAGLAGPALLRALRDPEPRVCAAAARSLRASGGAPLQEARTDPRLTPALRQLLVP